MTELTPSEDDTTIAAAIDNAAISPSAHAAATVSEEPFDFEAMGDVAINRFVPTHPVTGEPVAGVYFDFYGEDTAQYRKARSTAEQKQGRRLQRNPDSLLQSTEFSMDLFVGALAAWGGVRWAGKDVPLHDSNGKMQEGNVKLVFSRQFLVEQARAFLNNREKRLGKS